MRRLGLVIFIVYLIIGVFVARAEGYLKGIDDLQSVVSLVLAVALWPLVLLGIDFDFGGGGKGKRGGGRKRGGGKGVLIPFALWRVRQEAKGVMGRLRHTPATERTAHEEDAVA